MCHGISLDQVLFFPACPARADPGRLCNNFPDFVFCPGGFALYFFGASGRTSPQVYISWPCSDVHPYARLPLETAVFVEAGFTFAAGLR